MDMEGLSVICTGLGFADEDDEGALIGYSKSEYCLDNLKDLARFLRRDDAQQRRVFKQICKWNTVSKDLVPIIEYYQSDRNLVINAVKILVFLTMPIDLSSDNIGQQIEYLWELKDALTRHVTIAVIVSLLEDPLSHLESDAFTEEDWKLVQLVLTLFRNLLAIQDITPQQRASGSATRFLCLADRFLELMFQENVLDLILVLTQHVEDSSGYLQEENLLLLEIFYYVFLGRDAEMIAKISRRSSKADETVEVSTDSLRLIMEEEAQTRRIARLRNLERHSQFSGTFTRLNMDGAKMLFKRNPKTASANNLIKAHRFERGPLKKIASDHGTSPSPNKGILESLSNFLSQFLSGGYNVLMQSICDDIRKEHQSIQKNDIIMFFRVVHFVLAFQHQKVLVSKKSDIEGPASDVYHEDKHADDRSSSTDVCGPVSATINEIMFNLVISKWREAFEGLKETNDYKSLSAAGSVMKNMFRMLDLVLRLLPEDSKESQIARVLLYKLLYDQTEQGLTQFLFNLFKSFDSHKQPKSDLADLLEMIHVLLRLMEKLQTHGALRVAKKSRKGRKKKILNDAGDTEINKNIEHKSPDGADDTGERGEQTPEILLRADSADQTNEQSSKAITIEKESTIQQGTSVSNLAFDSSMHPEGGNLGDDVLPMDNVKGKNISHDMTDSSDDDQLPATNEVDFNISRLIASFANNVALNNLCWLLKFYKSNTVALNHYIICMLRRFCDDLELAPMLYQLSILSVFYDILSEQKSSISGEFVSIVNFLTKIVRNMMKLMKKQPLLFVEILFWKTRRECHLINAEALLCDLANVKKGIHDLNTDHVGLPYNRPMQRSIADSLGDDEADLVVPYNLNAPRDEDSSDEISDVAFGKTKQTNKNNVRSMLYDFSEDMSENEDGEKSQRVTVSRSRKNPAFDQEQETMIKTLFEKYKDERKCSRLIAEALDPDGKISPVQVYRKLKQLGLQIGTKKRLVGGAVPCPTGDDPFAEGGHESTNSVNPSTSKQQENTSFGKYSSRRKRVQAFNEEQELEIKNLFERFKDHKKCSHMIAKALDADNKYTSAQVSRKLKQLGLLTTKQKKSSESFKHPTDKENVKTSDQFDDETLLSVIQSRGKKKRSSRVKDDDMITSTATETEIGKEVNSEDENLATMLQNQGKKVKLSAENATLEEKVSDYDSDKEILSSMLKSKPSHQSEQLPTHGDEPANLDTLDDDIEDELENPSLIEQEKHLDLMHLDESDDDRYPSMHKSGNKRNLKLVIDEEDE